MRRHVAKILILLSILTTIVKSQQGNVDAAQEHLDESVKWHEAKYSEKYNSATETECKDETPLLKDDKESCGSCLSKNDCNNLVLKKEEHEHSEVGNSVSEHECILDDTNTCLSSTNAADLTNEEHHTQMLSKPGDIAQVQQTDVVYENENEKIQKGTGDLEQRDETTSKEIIKEELDVELENVPLREILLKLKPEGLTDDEDDQPSDYSVSETGMEADVEVEEVLVSSGSTEKQEQGLDTNATKETSEGDGGSSTGGSKKAVCSEVNTTDLITDVEIINATKLLKLLQVDPNITSRSFSGPCYLIYFYSPYCPFSVMGSPYINALSRSIPNIPIYGLDSIEHHSVNARYGVMGTPTLLLFHNGNGVGRYNASEYSVSQLMSFIKHYTDQDLDNINVTSSDFRANLPSQLTSAHPYALWAAWIFLLSFASWLFLTSEMCARLMEAILNNWREAEAQNDHQD